MADQKTRLYSLPEITEINSDMYLMLDASATGVRKYNLKTMYDKLQNAEDTSEEAVTRAEAAIEQAGAATATATAAADSANTAATAATEAATSAGETVAGLVEDVDEALDAIGDISEQAVPLMSATTRGGAKLGTGLEVSDGTLSRARRAGRIYAQTRFPSGPTLNRRQKTAIQTIHGQHRKLVVATVLFCVRKQTRKSVKAISSHSRLWPLRTLRYTLSLLVATAEM